MLRGSIKDALMLNPNCLFAVLYLFAYPALLLLSLINRNAYIMTAYILLDRALHNKICLYALLGAELIIWVHNILTGI